LLDQPAMQWGKLAITVIVTLGFLGCMIVLLTVKIDLGSSAEKAFLILVGALSQTWGMVMNWWFGSSAGSAAKGDQLAALAAANGGKLSG
jgi:hypothetical protein